MEVYRYSNKSNQIRYGRVRHYVLKTQEDYNPKVKYNFRYHKIENLQQLESLLNSTGFQFPTTQQNTPITSQTQANQNCNNGSHWVGLDHAQPQAQFGLKDLAFISRTKGAGSSVRIEHHPPKVGVVGSNPTPPATTKHISLLRV
jgi:hypothetical protein